MINNKVEKINLFGEDEAEQISNSLKDRWLVNPFSILNANDGNWIKRKKLWKSLGIKSELGRANNLVYNTLSLNKKLDENKQIKTDTSIFDPVTCEVCYKWFCPEYGKIFDPFAGGSVRGVVASILKHDYIGIDLSETQIDANESQIKTIKGLEGRIVYINDDSRNLNLYIEPKSQDLVFTCPPYFNLEVYSDKKEDISNMDYNGFSKCYRDILHKSCDVLKDDRFFIVVISKIRDKNGYYIDLVRLTIDILAEKNVKLYNDIIYWQSLGTAKMRANGQFTTSRKVVKTHQNILVFYKGDIKKIKYNYKELDLKY